MRLNRSQVLDDLESHVLKAVDKALLVLGESGKRSIFQYLERRFGVKHDEIPKRLVDFHEYLSVLLGEGAKLLEKNIARELCHQLQIDFTPHENSTITGYVNNAKETIKTGTK